MTSDVIRCRYMSYNPLFHNCLHGHNFAKSEPMNGLNIFRRTAARRSRRAAIRRRWILCSTNRASCVFVRQKLFCHTKITCPPYRVGGFSSKVGKSDGESKNNPKSRKAWRKNRQEGQAEKPKTDPADYKVQFPPERTGEKQI